MFSIKIGDKTLLILRKVIEALCSVIVNNKCAPTSRIKHLLLVIWRIWSEEKKSIWYLGEELKGNDRNVSRSTGTATLAAPRGTIAASRRRLVFPMCASGAIEHVLNYAGGSWYTRNYSVFIGRRSRTAFRNAYRIAAMHLFYMRQWNHTGDLIHWVNTFDVFCDRLAETFREHDRAISSSKNVFGNVNHFCAHMFV